MSSAKRLKLPLIAGALLLGSLDIGAAVWAGPADIAAAKARQDKMRDMGSAFKSVNDELKKSTPDWNIIQPSAGTVANRASFLLTWFPKGSGPEVGSWSGVNGASRTYALPAIWQKPDDFTRLGKANAAEAAKLNQLAEAKDIDGLKAQYMVVGKGCKACHQDYRSPDYEKDNSN